MAVRLRFAYMTSVRKLIADGQPASLIELLVPRLHHPADPLGRAFELAAAVVDDTDSELAPIMRSTPPWPNGIVPRGLLLRMPSTWRRLARCAGESLEDFARRRHGATLRHETALARALASRGVDVILSDSYVVPFGTTMLDAFGGRILDVHTGLFEPGPPAHTATRDTFTPAAPGGAVDVPRVAMAGVSVHVVTDGVDGGPVLASERWTFDPARVTRQQVRHESCRRKARVVPQALERWAEAYRSYCSSGRVRPSGVDGQSPMRRAPILT